MVDGYTQTSASKTRKAETICKEQTSEAKKKKRKNNKRTQQRTKKKQRQKVIDQTRIQAEQQLNKNRANSMVGSCLDKKLRMLQNETGQHAGRDVDIESEDEDEYSVRGGAETQNEVELFNNNENLNNTEVFLPRASVEEQLKCKADRVEEMLVKFVSGEVFPLLKFVGPSHLRPLLRAAEKANNFINYRGDIPSEVFDDHFEGKVSTVFSKMRHKTQCLSRTTFLSM